MLIRKISDYRTSLATVSFNAINNLLTALYIAAELALVGLGVNLSKALTETGITVNTIMPGFVVTDMLKAYYQSMPENEGKSWEQIELGAAREAGAIVGRLGLPSDVAAMVAHLCSPFGDWITGADFRIDGGMSGFIN